MGVYVTGDTHGSVIKRFSYRRNPQLRNLDSNDIVIVLGDWGVPWNKHTKEHDKYTIKFLNSKPWTTIALRGNHDNTDAMREMPQEERFGGKVRRLVIDNVVAERTFIIDEPTILTIGENRCLCIPGAESHDIWPIYGSFTGLNVIDKRDPNWRKQAQNFRMHNTFYRVKGESWWEDESIDIESCCDLLEKESSFEFILTHEAPALISRELGFKPTLGETYLETLRKTLNFNSWFHGHLHKDFCQMSSLDKRLWCMYHGFLQIA